MNYLDAWAGIGGFALGAYWAGVRFDRYYFSETDKYAESVYQKRFPDAIPLGDIRKIHLTGTDREVKYGDEKYIPQGDWIISGGFPCQDISVAGKGAGLDGYRSGLWFEYVRLIGEIRPRFAIMENVGALVVRGLDRVLGSLAEIGYDAIWQDIRAIDVGAPHRRERIWIIAYPGDWKPDSGHAAKEQEICGGENTESRGICGDVADAGCPGFHQRRSSENTCKSGGRSGGIFRNGLPGREEEEGSLMAHPKEQSGAVNGQKTFFSGRGSETMADADSEGLQGRVSKSLSECSSKWAVRESSTPMADTDSPGLQTSGAEQPATGISGCGEVSDTGSARIVKRKRQCWSYQQYVRTGENHGGRAQIDEIGKWWAVEPDVCCVADGLSPGLGRYEGRLANKSYRRRDQLKGYGNAVVPHIPMMIWLMIKEFL
jgi:DNA-cytosine methyltransferase